MAALGRFPSLCEKCVQREWDASNGVVMLTNLRYTGRPCDGCGHHCDVALVKNEKGEAPPPVVAPAFADLSRRTSPGGGSSTTAVWVMVCEPRRSEGGRADSHLVAWSGEAFDAEVNSVGSVLASDYGLDDVPGPGLWVLDGKVKMSAYRCNNPLDPEEWDTTLDYGGEWRRATAEDVVKAQSIMEGK